MTLDDAKLRYLDSSPEIQAKILARHAHTLTILARDTYVAGTEEIRDPVTLRKVNEIMHRITSHIYSLLNGDSERYPDDVFLSTATYPIETLQIESAFTEAVDRTIR